MAEAVTTRDGHWRVRMVSRLDIKAPNVIKGVKMDGLRVVGDPGEMAVRYYEAGIDELLYVDVVASLYQRPAVLELLRSASASIFLPLTVAGGVRTVDDARGLLSAGADKVGLNTAAIARPSILTELAREFGSQGVVLSIEAKRRPGGWWEALTDCGRERTGVDVVEWIGKAEGLGVGEVLLTSVDQDGTLRGFDLPLVEAAGQATSLPVVVSGGAGSTEDVDEMLRGASVSGFAVGRAFHEGKLDPRELRTALRAAGHDLRSFV